MQAQLRSIAANTGNVRTQWHARLAHSKLSEPVDWEPLALLASSNDATFRDSVMDLLGKFPPPKDLPETLMEEIRVDIVVDGQPVQIFSTFEVVEKDQWSYTIPGLQGV